MASQDILTQITTLKEELVDIIKKVLAGNYQVNKI